MVRAQPVVGVQEGDQVVTLQHRVGRPDEPRRAAEVAQSTGQDDVLGVPAVDCGVGPAVGYQDVAAGVGLGQHAVVSLAQHLRRLGEVGRDDGDSQGHG